MLLPFLAGLTAVLLMLALIGGRRRGHGKPTAADNRQAGRKHMTGEKKKKAGGAAHTWAYATSAPLARRVPEAWGAEVRPA